MFLMDVVVVPSLVPGSPVDLSSSVLRPRGQTVASVVVSDVFREGRLLSGRREPTDIHCHSMLRRVYLIFLQHFGDSVVASFAADSLVIEVYRLPFSPFLVSGFLQV